MAGTKQFLLAYIYSKQGGGQRNGDGRRSSGAREDPRGSRRRAIKQMLAGVSSDLTFNLSGRPVVSSCAHLRSKDWPHFFNIRLAIAF